METFTKEAQAEVVEAEAKTPEAAQPAEKTYTKAEHEAEILKVRQEGTRREQRIKELEGKAQLSDAQVRELGGLRQSLTTLEDMVATLLDGNQQEPQQLTYAQRLAQKRQQAVVQTPQIDPTILKQTTRLDILVEDLELAPDAPELAEAKRMYNNPDEGYEATVKYLKGLKVRETPEQMKARIKEEIRAELKAEAEKEYGNPNSVDTGSPRGGGSRSFTARQIAAMSDEEYKKNEAAIHAAQSAGRIKRE